MSVDLLGPVPRVKMACAAIVLGVVLVVLFFILVIAIDTVCVCVVFPAVLVLVFVCVCCEEVNRPRRREDGHTHSRDHRTVSAPAPPIPGPPRYQPASPECSSAP